MQVDADIADVVRSLREMRSTVDERVGCGQLRVQECAAAKSLTNLRCIGADS